MNLLEPKQVTAYTVSDRGGWVSQGVTLGGRVPRIVICLREPRS